MPVNTEVPTMETQTGHSPQMAQQFQASGVAQVMVVLRRSPMGASLALGAPSGAGSLSNLSKHFVTPEFGPASAVRGTMSASRAARGAGETLSAGLALGVRGPVRGGRGGSEPPVRVFANLGIVLGSVTPAGLDGLRRESDVATVTAAPVLTLIRPRAKSAAKLQNTTTWGLSALEIPRLWNSGINGDGIVVAHLDTGADGKHPALRNAFQNFAEFDDAGDEVAPAPKPHDTGEHGTHTAATIAGRAVSGLSMGVAPGAKLASAIVIEGGNVVARVLGGLNWALDQQVKVLSMSLGLVGWWDDFLPVIQILRARGVLPVIAVGNDFAGTSRSPGNYAESLSVGAVDRKLVVPAFSSSQRFARPKDPSVPDLVGPGVDCISAVPGGKYASMSGTSMATPHIAGLAALLFQAKPGATISEVENAIFHSCRLAPGMTADRAGLGFPNGPAAYQALTGNALPAAASVSKTAAKALKKKVAKPRRKPTVVSRGAKGPKRKKVNK